MRTVKRTVKVVTEQVIEIEMPESYGFEQYLKDFGECLWKVDSIDDIFAYAAGRAANLGPGDYEGIGYLNYQGCTVPQQGDVTFKVLDDDCEVTVMVPLESDGPINT